jgi:hypothetical protein
MFSPGNLRATFDNPNYERLLSHYIGEKYTLRYTGGMVRARGQPRQLSATPRPRSQAAEQVRV